jgi:hypothetical protein
MNTSANSLREENEKGTIQKQYRRIYAFLLTQNEACTAKEIEVALTCKTHKRMADLRRCGAIRWFGKRRCLATGKPGKIAKTYEVSGPLPPVVVSVKPRYWVVCMLHPDAPISMAVTPDQLEAIRDQYPKAEFVSVTEDLD